ARCSVCSSRPPSAYSETATRLSIQEQGVAGPPFQNPPSVGDVGGATGASLRDWSRRRWSREDQLKHRAEPVLSAFSGFPDQAHCLRSSLTPSAVPPSSARTHVSRLPPPWELLTTSEPGRS